uniref:Uncharacterized protein n=1 Tax=Cacopsylla melanoneura TaxID=428564 RepID=A0A8D9BD46_9HEMI
MEYALFLSNLWGNLTVVFFLFLSLSQLLVLLQYLKFPSYPNLLMILPTVTIGNPYSKKIINIVDSYGTFSFHSKTDFNCVLHGIYYGVRLSKVNIIEICGVY